jgi:adenylate kinase family enzyme
MIDIITQYILNEGYVLSDKTISINLSKFQSGIKKKLLVLGVSGSGKTTLGEKLSEQFKVKWISIDSLYWRIKQRDFKNVNETKEQLVKKVHEEVISYLKSNERMVIEGIDILELYHNEPKYRNLILKQPVILLGISSLRAGIRAAKRNREREDEGWMSYYWMQKFNWNIEPLLKQFRKDVIAIPGVEIKEYS